MPSSWSERTHEDFFSTEEAMKRLMDRADRDPKDIPSFVVMEDDIVQGTHPVAMSNEGGQ